MANHIDNRIVEMRFENRQFESNIQTSIDSIETLKKSLNMDGTAKGFDALEKAAGVLANSSLEQLTATVDNLANRFSLMGIAGMTVVSKLTDSAIEAAKKISNFTIGSITQGGWNRATNIENAKFQLEGLGIAWEEIQEDINYGVQDTAYGLDSAARAAAQLAASQVEVGDEMKTALRAISGVAAMTNSTYDDISMVFTTVAGNGRLMANELNRLSARGMNAAAALGKYLGKTEKEVREMTSKGQIDFATFAAAMDDAFGEHAKDSNKTFDGALSNMKAALSRIGAEFATPLRNDLRDVFNAIRPLINAFKNELGPVISEVTKIMKQLTVNTVDLLGEINKTSIFKNIVDTIRFAFFDLLTFIQPIKDAFRDIFPKQTVKDFEDFTKRLRDFVSHGYATSKTANNLRDIFRGLFSAFDLGKQLITSLINAFLPAGKTLKDVGSGFLSMAAAIGRWITALNQYIKKNDTFTTTINNWKKVLQPAGNVITSAIDAIVGAMNKFGQAKKKMDLDGESENLSVFGVIAKGWSKIGEVLLKVFDGLSSWFDQASPFIQNMILFLKTTVGQFVNAIGEVFAGSGWNGLISLLSGTMITGLITNISSFVDTLEKKVKGAVNIVSNVNGVLREVQKTLEVFQNTLKAGVLIDIAEALGVMTLSIIGLSMVDSEKVGQVLILVASAVGALVGGMALLMKIVGKNTEVDLLPFDDSFKEDVTKFESTADTFLGKLKEIPAAFTSFAGNVKKNAPAAAKAMASNIGIFAKNIWTEVKALAKEFITMKLAADMIRNLGESILMVSGAMLVFSKIDSDKMIQSLIMFGSALVGIVGGMILLTKFSKDVPKGLGLSLIGLGAAILEFSVALSIMANVAASGANLVDMAGALVGALLGMAGAMKIMAGINPGTLVAAGAAMAMLGYSLIEISAAMVIFNAIPDISKPLIALGLAFTAVAVGLYALSTSCNPAELLAVGGSMAILGLALIEFAGAVAIFAAIPTDTIIQGMAAAAIAIGGTMLALHMMTGEIPVMIAAAGAMLIVGAALNMFIPPIIAMGMVPWQNLLIGLGGFIAIFASFIGLGYLATGAAVGLVAIGGAIALLGSGAASAGIGVFAFASGLRILSEVIPQLSASVWGLIGMAAGLLVFTALFGLLSVVLTPVIVPMLAVGGAIALLGVGFLAAGAGASLLINALAGVTNIVMSLGTSFENVSLTFGTFALQMSGSLLMVAAAMLGFAAAGTIATGATVPLLAIGGAVLMIGAGIGIATIGMTMFVDSIAKLGEEAVIGSQGLITISTAVGQFSLALLGTSGAIGTAALALAALSLAAVSLTPGIIAAGLFAIALAGLGMASEVAAKGMGAMSDAIIALSATAPLMEYIARMFIGGFVKGIIGGIYDAVNAVKEFGKTIINAAAEVLGVHSPSIIAEWLGKMFGKGTEEGILSSIPGVSDASTMMGNTAITSLNSALTNGGDTIEGTAFDIGSLIPGAFGDGVSSNKFDVQSAMEEFGYYAEQPIYDSEKNIVDSADIYAARYKATWVNAAMSVEDQMDLVRGGTEREEYSTKKNTEAKNENTTATNKNTGSRSSSTKETSKLTNATEALTEATKILNEKYGDALKVMGKTIDIKTAQKALDALGMSMEDFGEMTSNIESKVKSTLDKIFDAPKDRGWMDKNAILQNMRDNINQVQDWVNVMSELGARAGSGLTSQLYKYLSDMGPEGYKYAKAFSEMTDEELQEASGLFQQSMTMPKSASAQISASFVETGLMAVEGYAQGLLNTGDVERAATELAEAGIDAVKTAQDSHSPSRVYRQLAQWDIDGLVLGWYDGVPELVFAIKTVANRIITEFEIAASQERFKSIGTRLLESIVSGMYASVDTLNEVIKLVLENITIAIETKSKEINQNGRYICEHLVEGFHDEMVDQKKEIESIIELLYEHLVKSWQDEKNKEKIEEDIVGYFIQTISEELLSKKTTFKTLDEALNALIDHIVEVMTSTEGETNVLDKFKSIGEFWIQGLIEGIDEKLPELAEKAQEVAELMEKVTMAGLGEHSPSKVAEQLGKWWDEGLANGIKNNTGMIKGPVSALVEGVVNGTELGSKKLTKAFTSVFGKVEKVTTKKFTKTLSSITNQVKVWRIADNIADVFVPVSQLVGTLGDNISKKVRRVQLKVNTNVTQIEKRLQKALRFVRKLDTDVKNLDSIDNVIKSLDKVKKYFGDSEKLLPKVRTFLKNLDDAMKPVNADVEKLAKKLGDASSAANIASSEMLSARSAILQLGEAILYDTEVGQDYQKALEDLAKAQEEYDQAEAEGNENLDEFAEKLAEAEGNVESYITVLSKAVEEYRNKLASLYKSQIDFKKAFDPGEAIEPTSLLGNLKSYKDAFKTWKKNLLGLAQGGGLGFDMVKALADEGLDSYATVEALSQLSDKELYMFEKFKKKAEKQAEKAAALAIASIGTTLTSEWAKKREDIANSFNMGDQVWFNIWGGGEKAIEKLKDFSENFKSETKVLIDETELSFKSIKKIVKGSITDLRPSAESFKTLMEYMGKSMKDIDPVIDALGDNFLGISELSKDMTTDGLDARIALIEMAEALGIVQSSSESSSHYIKRVADAIKQLRDETFETLSSQVNPFAKLDMAFGKSAGGLLGNLKSNNRGLVQWKEDMVNLATSGIDLEIYNKLREQGLDGGAIVHALTSADPMFIQHYNEEWTKTLMLEEDAANAVTAGMGSMFDKGFVKQKEAWKLQYDLLKTTYGYDAWLKLYDGNTNALRTFLTNYQGGNDEFVRISNMSTKEVIRLFGECATEVDADGYAFGYVMDQMCQSMEPLNGSLDILGEKYLGVSDLSKDLSAETGILRLDIIDLADSFGMIPEAGEDVESFLDRVTQGLIQWSETIQDTIRTQIDPFAKFNSDFKLSASELLDNMESQANGVETWMGNLEELASRGMSSALLKYLAELGPQGAEYVNAFMEMTDAQLGEANERYAKIFEIPQEAKDRVLAAFEFTGTEAGKKMQDGLATAFAELGKVRFPYGEEEDLNEYREAGYQEGSMLVEGQADGAIDAQPKIIEAVEGTGEQINKTLSSSAKNSTFAQDYGDKLEEELPKAAERSADKVTKSMNTDMRLLTKDIEKGFEDVAKESANTFMNKFSEMLSKLQSSFEKTATSVSNTFKSKLTDAIQAVSKSLDDSVTKFDTDFVRAIGSAANEVESKLKNAVDDLNQVIADTAKKFDDIPDRINIVITADTYQADAAIDRLNQKIADLKRKADEAQAKIDSVASSSKSSSSSSSSSSGSLSSDAKNSALPSSGVVVNQYISSPEPVSRSTVYRAAASGTIAGINAAG